MIARLGITMLKVIQIHPSNILCSAVHCGWPLPRSGRLVSLVVVKREAFRPAPIDQQTSGILALDRHQLEGFAHAYLAMSEANQDLCSSKQSQRSSAPTPGCPVWQPAAPAFAALASSCFEHIIHTPMNNQQREPEAPPAATQSIYELTLMVLTDAGRPSTP